jgi:hypothetical protein
MTRFSCLSSLAGLLALAGLTEQATSAAGPGRGGAVRFSAPARPAPVVRPAPAPVRPVVRPAPAPRPVAAPVVRPAPAPVAMVRPAPVLAPVVRPTPPRPAVAAVPVVRPTAPRPSLFRIVPNNNPLPQPPRPLPPGKPGTTVQLFPTGPDSAVLILRDGNRRQVRIEGSPNGASFDVRAGSRGFILQVNPDSIQGFIRLPLR